MLDKYLENDISLLYLDHKINTVLIDHHIITIRDLWELKRKDLKKMNLSDSQINQIIIKLQLNGIDLNKKVHYNDRLI